jgi:outer membrane protein assembly factor BamB
VPAGPADASTATAWSQTISSHTYNTGGPGGTAIAVSPDGSTDFVTGIASGYDGGARNSVGETVAYNASTGATVWKATLTSGSRAADALYSIAVSPDGSAVFVAGYAGQREATHQVIIAYNPATGAKLWQITGPATAARSAIAVSPDSSTLYVDGGGQTMAYRTATGATLWTDAAGAAGMALSTDGTRLFLTSVDGGTGPATTEALDASTGAMIWQAAYRTTDNTLFTSAAVSPRRVHALRLGARLRPGQARHGRVHGGDRGSALGRDLPRLRRNFLGGWPGRDPGRSGGEPQRNRGHTAARVR